MLRLELTVLEALKRLVYLSSQPQFHEQTELPTWTPTVETAKEALERYREFTSFQSLPESIKKHYEGWHYGYMVSRTEMDIILEYSIDREPTYTDQWECHDLPTDKWILVTKSMEIQ